VWDFAAEGRALPGVLPGHDKPGSHLSPLQPKLNWPDVLVAGLVVSGQYSGEYVADVPTKTPLYPVSSIDRRLGSPSSLSGHPFHVRFTRFSSITLLPNLMLYGILEDVYIQKRRMRIRVTHDWAKASVPISRRLEGGSSRALRMTASIARQA